MRSKCGVKEWIFSLNVYKMKTSDKFWFCSRISFLHVFHKPDDIHINTDMVEQQNIWKWLKGNNMANI